MLIYRWYDVLSNDLHTDQITNVPRLDHAGSGRSSWSFWFWVFFAHTTRFVEIVRCFRAVHLSVWWLRQASDDLPCRFVSWDNKCDQLARLSRHSTCGASSTNKETQDGDGVELYLIYSMVFTNRDRASFLYNWSTWGKGVVALRSCCFDQPVVSFICRQ